MARIGLGPGWDVTFANDIDAAKCTAYRVNFAPADELREGDVHDLTAADLPGRADLAWASFPCQDLSLAGARGGLGARRSGAFWGFHRLMAALAAEGRSPKTLVIENVAGFATSNGGRDLAAAVGALADLGYAWDAQMIDAAGWTPQSRPRLFLIAWAPDAPHPGPQDDGARPALRRARAALDAPSRAAFAPRAAPAAPRANLSLSAVMEPDAPVWSEAQTSAALTLCAPLHRAKLDAALAEARATGQAVWGTGFRRMRGGEQRLELRFDRAGCLRTPAGGSSRQIAVRAGPDGSVSARWLTGREAARLMGLPDDYALPASATQALKLCGDGVAAPVARAVAEALIEPAIHAAAPPPRPKRAPALAPGAAAD